MVGWECPTNPREASGLDPEAVHYTRDEDVFIDVYLTRTDLDVERGDEPRAEWTMYSGPDDERDVMRPPFLPLVDASVDSDYVFVAFDTAQPPGIETYDNPSSEINVTIRENGDLVAGGERTSSSPFFSLPSDADGTVNTTAVVEEPMGHSSRVVFEGRSVPRADTDRGDVPALRAFQVQDVGPRGAVDGSTVEIETEFTGATAVEDLTVLYTTDDDAPVPVRGGEVVDDRGWKEASVVQRDDEATRFTVEFPTPEEGDSLSLAVLAEAENGNTFAATWFDPVTIDRGDDGESKLAPYTNEDGIVTDEGVQRAIQDWALGEISDQTISQAIQAWASGDPVT